MAQPPKSRLTHRPSLPLRDLIALGFEGGTDTGFFGSIRPAGSSTRSEDLQREIYARYKHWAAPSVPPMTPVYSGQGPVGTSRWAREAAADPERRRGYRKTDQSDAVGGGTGTWFNGRLAPKCNIFVYDALRSSGIQPPLIDGNVPVAAQWADPNQVAGYRTVGPDEPLQPGDVISNGDHVGVYTPEIVDGRVKRHLTTSAATPRNPFEQSDNPVLGGPVTNDWGFREAGGQRSPGLVVRRYVAPEKRPRQTPAP